MPSWICKVLGMPAEAIQSMVGDIPYGNRKEDIRAVLLHRAREGKSIYYGELGQILDIPARGPWKPVLDVSHEERGKSLPDITYLVISKTSGLPGQIEFKPAKPPTPEQIKKANDTLENIFAHYRPQKTS
jgi:hypothetical protein